MSVGGVGIERGCVRLGGAAADIEPARAAFVVGRIDIAQQRIGEEVVVKNYCAPRRAFGDAIVEGIPFELVRFRIRGGSG